MNEQLKFSPEDQRVKRYKENPEEFSKIVNNQADALDANAAALANMLEGSGDRAQHMRDELHEKMNEDPAYQVGSPEWRQAYNAMNAAGAEDYLSNRVITQELERDKQDAEALRNQLKAIAESSDASAAK